MCFSEARDQLTVGFRVNSGCREKGGFYSIRVVVGGKKRTSYKEDTPIYTYDRDMANVFLD